MGRRKPHYELAFAETLNRLCAELDGPKAWTAFGARIGTSAKNAERWCTGAATPSVTDAGLVAQKLGYSLDELVGRANPRQSVTAAAAAVPAQLEQIEDLLHVILRRIESAQAEFTEVPAARSGVGLGDAPGEAPAAAAARRAQRGKRAATRSTRPPDR